MDIVDVEDMTPVPPEPSKARTMDFIDAIRQIMQGKYVKRVSWGNNDYCLMKDGWLSIYTKGEFHSWTVNDGDMEGQDWIIVTEPN